METITGSDTMNFQKIFDDYILPLIMIELLVLIHIFIIILILGELGVIQWANGKYKEAEYTETDKATTAPTK